MISESPERRAVAMLTLATSPMVTGTLFRTASTAPEIAARSGGGHRRLNQHPLMGDIDETLRRAVPVPRAPHRQDR